MLDSDISKVKGHSIILLEWKIYFADNHNRIISVYNFPKNTSSVGLKNSYQRHKSFSLLSLQWILTQHSTFSSFCSFPLLMLHSQFLSMSY